MGTFQQTAGYSQLTSNGVNSVPTWNSLAFQNNYRTQWMAAQAFNTANAAYANSMMFGNQFGSPYGNPFGSPFAAYNGYQPYSSTPYGFYGANAWGISNGTGPLNLNNSSANISFQAGMNNITSNYQMSNSIMQQEYLRQANNRSTAKWWGIGGSIAAGIGALAFFGKDRG
jgi:hypothetical protein